MKTLKDLGIDMQVDGVESVWGNEFVPASKLRACAVEWVKSKECPALSVCNEFYCDNCRWEEVFKLFFNLTEEDLK